MSESDPHDLPEPFDPLEHLGPLEGDSPSPLDDLDLGGLTDRDSDPFGVEHAAPAAAESHFVPSPTPTSTPAPTSMTPARTTVTDSPRVSMSRKPSALPVLATVLGTAAVMLGGAFALSRLMPPAPPPAPTTTAAPTASATSEPTASTTPASDETKALTSRLDGEVKDLVARVDGLQKQITAMPKPAPATDLAPIEARLDALAKKADTPAPTPTTDVKALEDKVARTSDTLADLSKKIDAIGDRAAAMEKTLDADKSALATLQGKIKDLSEPKPAPAVASTPASARTAPANPAPSTPEAVPAANEAEMAKAIDLFKKGQYPQARDAFARLRQSVPNDAIVWYYSAVTNGFATGVWTGETDQLVNKGLELEKAGSPDAAKVNAAFADLTPSVKGWLDAYRARIAR